MATYDVPYDLTSGDPRFDLIEPLERLQTLLNEKNVDIESLDARTESMEQIIRGFEPMDLQKMIGMVDNQPEMTIPSSSVRDLNERFDKNLDNSNPNFIFRDDVITRNNINTIRNGNASFARSRDIYITPPPKDVQQKIFELLKSK
jgi:hypothetical protein